MLIQVKRAQALVFNRVREIESENISTELALDRVLAEDVISSVDFPRFDQSSVDGFAVRSKDFQGMKRGDSITLEIGEFGMAGNAMGKPLRPIWTSHIATGALLPVGADAVIKVENIIQEENQILVNTKVKKGQNIKFRGCLFKKGKILYKRGTQLGPYEISSLIAAEVKQVKVFKRPRVAILVTGDELVEWNKPIKQGKIYNSNSYLLKFLLQRSACEPIDMGIVNDDRRQIESRLYEALSADAVCTAGGQSVGKKDYLKNLSYLPEFERVFWRVKMKPGFNTSFHIARGKPIFGLSGNLHALFIGFEIIFRPAIMKMAGIRSWRRPIIEGLLSENMHFNPDVVNYREAYISLVKGMYQATTKIFSFQSKGEVNGIIEIPPGIKYLRKDSMVKAYIIGSIGG